MKRILFSLLVFLVCPQAFTDDSTTTNDAGDVVVQDTRATSLSPADHIRSVFDYSELGDKFINSQGTLGEYGQSIVQAIQRVGADCFLNKLDVASICPGFSSMSNEDKINKFYPYFFGAIAIGEAENAGVPANRPRGQRIAFDEAYYLENLARQKPNTNAPYTFKGLFRLERENQFRRRNGRPRPFCDNIDNFQSQANCAAAMINQLHCQRSKPIPLSRGYWVSLRSNRGNDGDATDIIKAYPGCNAN